MRDLTDAEVGLAPAAELSDADVGLAPADSLGRRFAMGVGGVISGAIDTLRNPAAAIANIPSVAINTIAGREVVPEPFRYNLGREIADTAGLPRPATPAERIVDSAVQGGAGMIGPMAGARAVQGAAGVVAPMMRGTPAPPQTPGQAAVGAFANNPGTDIAAGAVGGAAGGAVEQAGGGVIGQVAGEVAGNIITAAIIAAVARRRGISPESVRPESITPEEIQGVSPEVVDAYRAAGISDAEIRQALDAFTLANAQRQRAAPGVRDPQPGAAPDPADATPRMAQDFQERAATPRNPEMPREADAPVTQEPPQTFRYTEPDPNTQFPGATTGEAPRAQTAMGRTPFPDQSEVIPPSRMASGAEPPPRGPIIDGEPPGRAVDPEVQRIEAQIGRLTREGEPPPPPGTPAADQVARLRGRLQQIEGPRRALPAPETPQGQGSPVRAVSREVGGAEGTPRPPAGGAAQEVGAPPRVTPEPQQQGAPGAAPAQAPMARPPEAPAANVSPEAPRAVPEGVTVYRDRLEFEAMSSRARRAEGVIRRLTTNGEPAPGTAAARQLERARATADLRRRAVYDPEGRLAETTNQQGSRNAEEGQRQGPRVLDPARDPVANAQRDLADARQRAAAARARGDEETAREWDDNAADFERYLRSVGADVAVPRRPEPRASDAGAAVPAREGAPADARGVRPTRDGGVTRGRADNVQDVAAPAVPPRGNADRAQPSRAPAGRAQTNTPEFRRWFGGSKVTDAEGRPLRVYHGTLRNFDEFRLDGPNHQSYAHNRVGFWFDASPVTPGTFADGTGGNIAPVYLSIENPLVLDSQPMPPRVRARIEDLQRQGRFNEAQRVEMESGRDAFDDYMRRAGMRNDNKREWDRLADRLRDDLQRQGYDGIHMRGTMADSGSRGDQPTDWWIAFRPEQIKSATGNRGTFDPNSPNILYANPLADPAAWRRFLVDPVTGTIQSLRNRLRNSVASIGTTPGVGAFWRLYLDSARATLLGFQEKYSGVPGMRELVENLGGTDPGSGRRVAAGYQESADATARSLNNRVANVLRPLGDNAESLGRVRDILTGGNPRGATPAERAAAQRLRTMLDDHHAWLSKRLGSAERELGYVRGRYFPRRFDAEAIQADLSGFVSDAKALYRRMGLDDDMARLAADEWANRVMGIGGGARYGDTPASAHTKGRTLPPDADTLMRKWLVTDPREALSGYFESSTRHAEFVSRFGPNGQKFDDVLKGMRAEGATPTEIDILKRAFASATGTTAAGINPTTGLLSWTQMWGMRQLLTRALFSSAMEPISVGLRSGNLADSYRALGNTWRRFLTPDSWQGTGMKVDQERAEMLGVIGDAQREMLMAARVESQNLRTRDATRINQMLAITGQNRLFAASRIASSRIAEHTVAKLVGRTDPGARRALAELGMNEADASAVAAWLRRHNGKPPVSELAGDTPAANAYRTAVNRFVNESIVNPLAVDRPIGAGERHPLAQLAYGIMSFQYAFTRNVLIRAIKQSTAALTGGNGMTAGERLTLLVPLAGMGVLAAAQMGMSEARDAAFNRQAARERPPFVDTVLAMDRAGMFGNLSPLVNMVTSAKYERDASGALAGAYLGNMARQVADMTTGRLPEEFGGRNSPNTNNAEWASVRAAWGLIAAPAMVGALAAAPVPAWAKPLAGGAAMYVGSSDASRTVATAVAGERPPPRGAPRQQATPRF